VNLNARKSQGLESAATLSPLLSESFAFFVGGVEVKSDMAEAVALSPSVREQLSVDSCARKFVQNDGGIGASDLRSLQCFLYGDSNSFDRRQAVLSQTSGDSSWAAQNRATQTL
jgi:hypothetical protein